MKIAFLNIYNGVFRRGSETYVDELAARLASKNKVTVFQAGDVEKNKKYSINKIDIRFDWTKKDSTGTLLRRLFLDYWSLRILVFTLKSIPKIWKEKYDVIIPLNGGWQSILTRKITWLYGGKVVCSAQSGKGWDDRINLLSFPNRFVALSTKVLEWAKKVNPLVKSVYIPNGVDLGKFTPKGSFIETGLTKPVILSVGAFTKQKRLDLVIRAVTRLKDTSLLVVGGGGELKEKLKDMGERLLGNRFKILTLPFEEMPEVYRSGDVFTLPSASSEAFGNVFVEAMASGLPVVATNDPIRKEIIGDAGILVDPTEIDDFAAALIKALDTNWGDKPRKRAENFDWDKIAEQYEELFNKLK